VTRVTLVSESTCAERIPIGSAQKLLETASLIRTRRLTARTFEHGKTRILRVARVSRGPLAPVKSRPAVRLDQPHEPAVRAEAHAKVRRFSLLLAHASRITPCEPCSSSRTLPPATAILEQSLSSANGQQDSFSEPEEKFIEY